MLTINPYLNFAGNTEEAFNFYKSVFGGEFLALQRFKDTPEAGNIPKQEQDKIMHVALPIGNGAILMATDALESMGQKLTVGNNFYIAIQPEAKRRRRTLQRPFRRRQSGDAVAGRVLGRVLWNVSGQVRHSVDGQLRPEPEEIMLGKQ